jgi:hypothetical protein
VLNFNRKFDRPSQELTASAAYSGSRNKTSILFNNQDYELDFTPSAELPMLENNLRNVDNTVITLQADYIHPLANKASLKQVTKLDPEVDNDLFLKTLTINQCLTYNDTLSYHCIPGTSTFPICQ